MSVLLDHAPSATDTPPALTEEKPLLTVVLPDTYGRLSVREEFDEDTGDAYFTVVKGGRCTGTFTIGTYTWGLVAIPTGVGVWYGRGGADTHNLDRTDRPTVNGVRLSGGTHWSNPEQWRSFNPRLAVNTGVATSRYTSASAPDLTAERAGVIVLALLGYYMEHPRRAALRQAAAEYAAARRLRELSGEYTRLRQQIAEKQAQAAKLEAQLLDYARLDVELRGLAESYTQRVAARRQDGRA